MKLGYGHRIEGKGRKHPFDVLSPMAQSLIGEQWEQACRELELERSASPAIANAGHALAEFIKTRRQPLETQQQVSWLLDHFPCLTLSQIAVVIGVSRPQVSRYVAQRAKDRGEKAAVWEQTRSTYPSHPGDLGLFLQPTKFKG